MRKAVSLSDKKKRRGGKIIRMSLRGLVLVFLLMWWCVCGLTIGDVRKCTDEEHSI